GGGRAQDPGGPLEAGDLVPPLRRQGAALFGSGTGDPGHFPEDADPAAAPDGRRRDRAADRPSSGAAESRILPDGLGPGPLPRPRRAVAMGGAARSFATPDTSIIDAGEIAA